MPVLFGVGLPIYLFDTGSLAVAIPVAIVVGLVVVLYIIFTIMAFRDNHCAYSTTTSRMYYALRHIDPQTTSDDPRFDDVTIRAIR
jgi:hypothetical protein